MLFPRFAAERVRTALKDTPVVMVSGPRQCGKTTMVRQFASRNRTYINLDDDTVLEAVRNDPSGFVRSLDTAIVDEVQLYMRCWSEVTPKCFGGKTKSAAGS
jgi:uncharacterized protein